MHVKVKEASGLVKDTTTGALLNTKREEMEEYLTRKAALVARRKVDKTEERLDRLENQLDEIKELLLKALK
jgi:polyhydroxyalkanoate synthesis regulator phasin